MGVLSAATIEASVGRIPPELRGSPQFVSEGLSAIAGRPVIVKVETLNPVGAFKGRGAWLAVAEALAAGRATGEAGIVVASTGNFGQAVAYAGRAQGVPITVFADEHANPRKLDRIRLLGARLVIEGDDFDEARLAAARHADETGAYLLIDGQDEWTAVGAGTLAAEVSEAIERDALPAPVAAYVPVGNGALIAGVGTWLRHARPATRVLGVQSEGAPAMTLSWREGRPIDTPAAETRAGGIATRVAIPEAVEMMRDVVDDMLLVSEAEIERASATMREALGITAELAAGATLAALERYPPSEPGPVLLVVTGANAEA